MNELGLWDNRYYVQVFTNVIIFLAVIGSFIFYMQHKNPKWMGAWASVKSYMIAAPIVFLLSGLPTPWPYVSVVVFAIYGMKTYFRMTGMYHRTWFVWASYITIATQGYIVYGGDDRFFNIIPMFFCLALTFIPVFRNSSKQMIQYVSLTLMGTIFFGWGFLHMGRILNWEDGMLVVLYLLVLSEFSESMLFFGNRFFGKIKLFEKITNRFTLTGFAFSVVMTLILAFGMRSLLPDRSEIFWISTGLICAIWGRLGSFTFNYIRHDLGIKEAGVFIIGRADILARLDKLMFIAPAAYYVILILTGDIRL